MDFEHILYGTEDRVATITLNRPDKLNAWTGTMEKEVRQAVETAADDDAVRAIVITGAGRGFCAGADMNTLSGITSGERPRDPTPQERKTGPGSNSDIDTNYERRFSYLLRLPKPVIAAINGPIAGMGVCMSMFCDFRYMAESAKLTTAFARRGLIAEHGISWMLPKLVGVTNALDLLLSARTATPAELERIGLVRVLPDENFLPGVQQIARDLVTNSSPRSIGVMKRQVYDSMFQSLDTAWAAADEEMVKSFDSQDFKEGVAHFLEKRPPAFTGR